MSTLDETIQSIGAAALSPVKLYQDEGPENPPDEYAVWELAGGEDFQTMTGRSGMVQARVQFTIIARRNARVAALSSALRAAMRAAAMAVPPTLVNTPLGPGFSLPADMTTAKSRVLEFSIWFDEAP